MAHDERKFIFLFHEQFQFQSNLPRSWRQELFSRSDYLTEASVKTNKTAEIRANGFQRPIPMMNSSRKGSHGNLTSPMESEQRFLICTLILIIRSEREKAAVTNPFSVSWIFNGYESRNSVAGLARYLMLFCAREGLQSVRTAFGRVPSRDMTLTTNFSHVNDETFITTQFESSETRRLSNEIHLTSRPSCESIRIGLGRRKNRKSFRMPSRLSCSFIQHSHPSPMAWA